MHAGEHRFLVAGSGQRLNLSHDASAALVSEEGVLCCVQEERLDRVKFSYTFPERAIATVLRLTGARPDQIDAVAWTSIRPLDADYVDFLLAGNRHTALDAMTWGEKARLLPKLGRQAWFALSPAAYRFGIHFLNDLALLVDTDFAGALVHPALNTLDLANLGVCF